MKDRHRILYTGTILGLIRVPTWDPCPVGLPKRSDCSSCANLCMVLSCSLRNVRIVTCDVSQVPLVDAAIPVLKKERPGAEGLDQVVSVEMMETLAVRW